MPFLKCPTKELNLGAVLLSGQSFRWKKLAANGDDENLPLSNVYVGVAKHRVWKLWRENSEWLGYEVLARFSKAQGDDCDVLRDYFQLEIKLAPLYRLWAKSDRHFAELLKNYRAKLEGIRILQQDPLEAVFAFICSANNHIHRITNMVETLCELYGESTSISFLKNTKTFHDFADPKRMSDDPTLEAVLRDRGFGYRAPNIALAAKLLQDDEQFLKNLSVSTYERAAEELRRVRGVGAKVADCICLMGLRMHHVVPIDTHIIQITIENYLQDVPLGKPLREKHRQQIAAVWQRKFGPYAGWAQAVLFTAHLRQTDIRKVVGKKTLKKKNGEKR